MLKSLVDVDLVGFQETANEAVSLAERGASTLLLDIGMKWLEAVATADAIRQRAVFLQTGDVAKDTRQRAGGSLERWSSSADPRCRAHFAGILTELARS